MPDSLVDYTSNIKINDKGMILFYTTPNEIIPIIKNHKNSKSLDDIPTKLLKISHLEVSIILAKLFNEMIDDPTYPDLLKYTRLTPVHKKGSTTDTHNYRLIAVLKI